MRRVIRDGSSATSRRGDRTRIVALVATFLLLTAGMVVSMPGLMNASATSGSSQSHPGDDGNDDGHHSGDDEGHDDGHHDGDNEGHHDGDDDSECQNDDGHQGDDDGDDDSSDDHSGDDSGDDHSSDDHSSDKSGDSTDSAIIATSVDGSSTDGSHDDGSDDGHDDGSDDGSHDDGHHDGHDDGSDDGSDDGHDDGHHDGHDDGSDDDGDDDCTPPTTATLTLNKVVINNNEGSSTIADFTLTATPSAGGADVISGPDESDDPEVGISAEVPVSDSYVLGESGPDGYDASAWSCVGGTLDGDTLTLAAGDVANCTITNDDTPPPPPPPAVIHVQKSVDNSWGGTAGPAGFQLYIDGDPATQVEPHEVTAGVHVISELARPGYEQTGIACIDVATTQVIGDGGTVDLASGQEVACVVANAAIPAQLTLKKKVINDNGGNAAPGDFNLLIDGGRAVQSVMTPVKAGLHTVSEEPADGYRLVDIVCTDDVSHQTLVYDTDVNLALDQHATCTLTNDDDPVDLAITKTDDGQAHVAGGPAFDYTITVDNLGPRDANVGELVTVTDQLPAGFEFVSFPSICSAAGQTLTCAVNPADLEVADAPFVITVTVKASPGAASGMYTNMAYVDTADDPACIGEGCVPVCTLITNNIDCETTQLTRSAGIAIDKVDDVPGAISPGATYSYFIKVKNTGPSTFLANLTMTDPLPPELFFVSVSAPSPWTCSVSARVVGCTYGEVLQPNTFTPVVTVTVTLDPTFLGNSVVNEATAVATVNPPGSLTSQLVLDAPAAVPPADPGTVVTVTATDDETTVIVRNANLSIKKSVSQATATAGDQFNWILDITNHGPDLATNVIVTDTIPSAFEVIGTFPSAGLSCTNTANSVQCTAASLANGATISAVVQVRVLAAAAPGAVTNTATVVTDSTDSDTSDNTSSASITVTTAGSQAPVPPAPTPPASGGSSVSLPRTGNGSLSVPLTLAGLLFSGGIFSLVIARRRRAATT